jgi:hypothetical protein
MKQSFVLLCLLWICNLSGQTISSADTIYKHHRSLTRYWQSDERMIATNEEKPWYALGNYSKDSLKNGRWTYFAPEGTVYAEGRYKNGKKKGHWKYGTLEVVYPFHWQVTDVVTVKKDNTISIHDNIKIKRRKGNYYCDNGTVLPATYRCQGLDD